MQLGASVTIHDPKALNNTRKIFQDNVKYTTTFSSALKNCQCAIIMTQWKDYERINGINRVCISNEIGQMINDNNIVT